MGRATTKADLLQSAQQNYDKLMNLINTMPAELQQAIFTFKEDPKRKEAHWSRDQNLRDVMVHLYEWHQLLLGWIGSNTENTAGQPIPFLPAPYNWRSYGDMNVMFWERHQTTPLEKSLELFKESHSQVMDLLGHFSDHDLFSKNALTWTGDTTLGSYGVSATASHYDWALKKLKLHQKTRQTSKV